ncbi:MAG: PepSY domain-containing protein [Nitrososphaeraceae archaeon]|jgi:uncharacterized membrane protein YkoI
MNYTKILTTTAILGGILLAAEIGLGNGASNLISAKQSAEAQMMGGNDTGMMKSGDGMMKMGGNITGTVDLMSVISEAIGSKINVSLSDAATTAETSVGNESHAVSAELGENGGFLVYNIMVIDPNMNFSTVVVDPGNGEILLSEPISKEQHMMMHGMDRQGMMGPGMMMGEHDKMMMGPPGGMMMGGYPG